MGGHDLSSGLFGGVRGSGPRILVVGSGPRTMAARAKAPPFATVLSIHFASITSPSTSVVHGDACTTFARRVAGEREAHELRRRGRRVFQRAIRPVGLPYDDPCELAPQQRTDRDQALAAHRPEPGERAAKAMEGDIGQGGDPADRLLCGLQSAGRTGIPWMRPPGDVGLPAHPPTTP